MPLHGTSATRTIEAATRAQHPPHDLMARAGRAASLWGRALYPHARRIWVACGPGNNGGDGLVAARHWQAALGAHGDVTVTWRGDPDRLPADARHAWEQAHDAGLRITDTPPDNPDLVLDAIWGVGLQRGREWPPHLTSWLQQINQGPAPVLAIDLPSGLDSDTGAWLGPANVRPQPGRAPRHTLSLLTAKPGLFTADGREAAGDTWLDTLGADLDTAAADAWLNAPQTTTHRQALHRAHKGSHGDVAILGGQGWHPGGLGMTGAAALAARAALHAGAGRVYVGLLSAAANPGGWDWDPLQPELMFRTPEALLQGGMPRLACLVCGCGGGSALGPWLPQALVHPGPLVLDADALNHIAQQPDLQRHVAERRQTALVTVVTPHPLEAARLLNTDTASVQSDRYAAAAELARRLQTIVVLKGSGTVITGPDTPPWVNPSGNALLATAGTGDVLAGMVGAALSALPTPARDLALSATRDAVYRHGLCANLWGSDRPMVASDILSQGAR